MVKLSHVKFLPINLSKSFLAKQEIQEEGLTATNIITTNIMQNLNNMQRHDINELQDELVRGLLSVLHCEAQYCAPVISLHGDHNDIPEGREGPVITFM